jgi:hypothetical protein
MLIDTRVVTESLRFGDGPVEVGLRRLEIGSEDGIALWCRLTLATGSAAWPPETPPPPGWQDGSVGYELLVGLDDDLLSALDDRDAEEVTRDLLAGKFPDCLPAAAKWRPLIMRGPDGEPDATGWAAQAALGEEWPPEPMSSLAARVTAVMFDEGWEPRRAAGQPSVIVATTEPESGWALSATIDDTAEEVTIVLALPELPDIGPSAGLPADTSLVSFVEVDNGTVVYARVTTTAPPQSEIVAGMIDAVLDAAHDWVPTDES